MSRKNLTPAEYRIKFLAEHPGVSCLGCWQLQPMGIKCNIHRTESSSASILRYANEAGLVLTGTRVERVLAAEKALGLKPVYIN